MATQLLSLIASNATDADYRNWSKGISDAFTAFGIPKTTDTGQADWATALKPATANVYPNYEIRKFNDSLSSTHPVVFKTEFGATGSVGYPGLRFTFGTGSDGAGNITAGVSITAISNLIAASNINSTLSQSCALSGTSNRFGLAMFIGSNSGFYFCVERTKDSNGNDTGEGILISRSGGLSSQLANYYWNFSNAPLAEASGIFTPSVGGSGSDGTLLNIYPNFFYRGGTPIVGLNTIGIFNGDIQGTNPTTLTVLNGSHSYYFIGGVAAQLNSVARGGVTGTGIGMRWE